MRGLAFVCSKPQGEAEANVARRVANIEQSRKGDLEAMFDGLAKGLTAAKTREQNPAIVAEIKARIKITVDGLVAVQARLATRPDSMPTVATITAPVLAIAGAEDIGVTAAEMEALKAAPVDATSCIARCGAPCGF